MDKGKVDAWSALPKCGRRCLLIRIASSREMAMAQRSVKTRTKAQANWFDKSRDRGIWPYNLFPFTGARGSSGAKTTVDIELLGKGSCRLHLRCQINDPKDGRAQTGVIADSVWLSEDCARMV